MTTRECLPELLRRPLGRRVSRHVVMENSAGAQLQHYEHVQRAECGGDHNEEVAGHDYLSVVRMKVSQRCFGSSRRTGRSAQVPSHGTGRYAKAEFQLQFIGNAFLSPCHILGLPSLELAAAGPLAKAVFLLAWISTAKTAGTFPVPTDERIGFDVP